MSCEVRSESSAASHTLLQPSALVSVVVPAHNEASGIEFALMEIRRALQAAGTHFEIITVDDGSTDNTFSRLTELAKSYPECKAIRLSRNFGKEAAMLAGLAAARGDAVITMDADLQHPPHVIGELIARWRLGAKIVNAVKAQRAGDSWIIRWRANVFNTVMRKVASIDMRNACDFKLLDRLVVDVLIKRIPERGRFYRGLTEWIGLEQDHVPFSVGTRHAGEGKWRMRSLLSLAATATVSFTAAPLRVVTLLGVMTLAFGAVVGSDALWSWAQGRAVSGFATLIITLLVVSSFIMISLGIIGEYIARIYEEVKARPTYLIAATCGLDASEWSPAQESVEGAEADGSSLRHQRV